MSEDFFTPNDEVVDVDDSPQDSERENNLINLSSADRLWNKALFLLRSSKQLNLTYLATDQLCDSTGYYLERASEEIYKNVCHTLEDHQIVITPSMQTDIANACVVKDGFDELSTRAKREEYYRQNFHYVVSVSLIFWQQ